jgi:hypothetical protein
MRRAVAACTSPEVLFRGGVENMNVHTGIPAVPTDALSLAMENINLGTTAPVPGPGQTEPIPIPAPSSSNFTV